MNFLLSHWHCILPIAGIGVAMFFMREKPKKEKQDGKNDTTVTPKKSKRD